MNDNDLLEAYIQEDKENTRIKSNAIRLASELDRYEYHMDNSEAAAELRRLHQDNQQYSEMCAAQAKALFEMHKTHEELVEALELAVRFVDSSVNLEQPSYDSPPEPASKWDYEAYCLVGELNAALKKAKGEQ